MTSDPERTNPMDADESHGLPGWLGWGLRWVWECVLEGLAYLVLGL